MRGRRECCFRHVRFGGMMDGGVDGARRMGRVRFGRAAPEPAGRYCCPSVSSAGAGSLLLRPTVRLLASVRGLPARCASPPAASPRRRPHRPAVSLRTCSYGYDEHKASPRRARLTRCGTRACVSARAAAAPMPVRCVSLPNRGSTRRCSPTGQRRCRAGLFDERRLPRFATPSPRAGRRPARPPVPRTRRRLGRRDLATNAFSASAASWPQMRTEPPTLSRLRGRVRA
jgi:hypothetical protein